MIAFQETGAIFLEDYSSSSSRPVSVYRWRAHSRVVLFHALHRFQKDTRLCTYLVYCVTLYLLLFPLALGVFCFNPSSLLIQSILVLLCRLCLTFPRQVKALLLPPPHSHLLPPLSQRRLTQVNYRSRHNILRVRILPSLNVGFPSARILHPLSCRLHKVLLSPSI